MRDKLKHLALLAVVAFAVVAVPAWAATVITGKQVRNGSLTGADVRDRSLGPREFSAATRSAFRGSTGPQGPAGVSGPVGATGAQGPPGTFSTASVVIRQESSFAAASARCQSGERIIGGGGQHVFPVDEKSALIESYPSDNGAAPDSWNARVANPTHAVMAYAICAR